VVTKIETPLYGLNVLLSITLFFSTRLLISIDLCFSYHIQFCSFVCDDHCPANFYHQAVRSVRLPGLKKYKRVDIKQTIRKLMDNVCPKSDALIG
jgi:excinuclease UvrABC nuclease subunit